MRFARTPAEKLAQATAGLEGAKTVAAAMHAVLDPIVAEAAEKLGRTWSLSPAADVAQRQLVDVDELVAEFTRDVAVCADVVAIAR
jgi:hypothetical protein